METFYTDNQTYAATKTQLVEIEQSLAAAPGDSFTVNTAAADNYTLTVTSKTGNDFVITKAATGVVTRTCTRTNQQGRLPRQHQLVVSTHV